MRVISKRRLREFWEIFPESKTPLENWYRTAKKADWENIVAVRKSYSHADIYKDCVIFNIGGNKFRLIVKFRFPKNKVFVRFALTHIEYDKDYWKSDC